MVSVVVLIAAGSTEKGAVKTESKTKEDVDTAPPAVKESVAKSTPKKEPDIVSSSKGNEASSKSTAKTANEREKLKVKGLYIGMPAHEVIEAVTPSIKQLSSTVELKMDGENIVNTDGAIVQKAIFSCQAQGNLQFLPYGPEAWLTGVATGKSSGRSASNLFDLLFNDDFLFFCVSRTKEGEVEWIEFPQGRIFNVDSQGKELVQLFVNSYKLPLIAPTALLKSEETEKSWSCKLPFGVGLEIGKNSGTIALTKIPSEADEKAAKTKAAEQAKKGFN